MQVKQVTPRRPHPDLLELALLGGIGLLAVAFLLPVLVVAVLLARLLLAVLRRTQAARIWLLPPLGASVLIATTYRDLWPVYLGIQQHTGDAILTAALAGVRTVSPVAALAYAMAVLPFALTVAPLLAVFTVLVISFHSRTTQRNDETLVVPAPQEVCALRDDDKIDWLLPDVLGRGVVSLLSGPPGIGKSYFVWALLRAIQQHQSFFGLPANAPWHTTGRWPRRRHELLRVLWLTEEGGSFVRTREKFGIQPGLVLSLRRDQVRYETWEQLVCHVKKRAKRARCGYVIVDTVRAWCPDAEKDAAHANVIMGEVRRQWLAAGLGVLFLHHDTKAGGEHGAGVSGTYGLVGAVDELVELRRVKGREHARRMVCSRRFANCEITAELDAAYRYVADDTELALFDAQLPPLPADAPEIAPERPALAPHLASLVDLLRRAGAGGLSTGAVQSASKTARSTVLRHLETLEHDGYLRREKDGIAFVWYAVDLPTPPPTASPAYTAYLSSEEWASKRRLVLARCRGLCEACGAMVEEAEVEVHHLTYERVGEELLDDLIGLCPGCHRRAHQRE